MKIVIIGSGNIATHLAKTLVDNDHTIHQVYSKTLANACALANVVNSSSTNNLSEIKLDADLYVIAISDDVIQDVVDVLAKDIKGIIVHTSGATSIDVLDKFENFGVVYPPQSINKNIATDISLIPFGIEANTSSNFNVLFNLIQSIAPKSFACTTQQRLALHVSAVVANNFSNALFQMAYEILERENLDFNILKPIISETAQKVQNHLPTQTQTGPASRGDYNIINKHLKFLSQSPEENKIYQVLTDFIIKRHHK